MARTDERSADGIEIVLADDHTMVRRGLRMVLDTEDGLIVVAEAGDVESALRATREHGPRVVVLRALLAQEGRLDPPRAVEIVAHVAGALDEAHRHGLVHRDVKPGNILLGRDGDGERAYLTDFGVAKQRTAGVDLTRTGMAVGTADFTSPEQARGGDIDGRADVYSLGCVLFRALTGEVVFDRDSDLDKLWAHVHEPPPALLDVRPELPPALREAVAHALEKEPAARPQTAGALAREAVAAVGG